MSSFIRQIFEHEGAKIMIFRNMPDGFDYDSIVLASIFAQIHYLHTLT